ncbi:glycosyltransferase [Amycolatopsis xylanica]|uniref:Glycosyltransferase n=1 Tax=Amycolatopsis xylanica TaxID=589385 RepID=A0A1H2VQ34_9PSEU|nr:nucleotide disphospho-sugar-binding domain-containing protein [Amycolatopsis xylanica]SDW70465.1 glycosyltransferase [Amycolatopsis xylanica]
MRVLMLSTPFPSHFVPLVPLAWALRAAGHEVVVAAQPDVTDVAHSAGLCTAMLGDRFHGLDVVLDVLPEGSRLIHLLGKPAPEQVNLSFWQVHASYLLPRYLEFARAWRPDLVVSEQMEFAGPIVAAALGVPSIQHRWGVDAMSDWAREDCARSMRRICLRLGLDGFPGPSVLLDPCAPELQVPGIAPARPIRHVPFNGPGERPGWLGDRTADRRLCVTLGGQTLALNGVPLFRTIIEAAGALPEVETVVTADPAYWAAIGPVPRSVRLVPPTPLHLFLSTCDAVLHHGAANTTMTVSAAGLAQLVLPQMQDEFTAADRVAGAGMGLVIDTADGQDDPATVHAALEKLLADPRYGTAAAGIARGMAAMPSPAAVAAELATLR